MLGIFEALIIHRCRLQASNISCTREIIHRFSKRFQVSQSICRLPGSGRLSDLIMAEIKALVEEQMNTDDETTAYQLNKLLVSRGYSVGIRTIALQKISGVDISWLLPTHTRRQQAEAVGWARAHL